VGDSACVPSAASAVPTTTVTSRHPALVRATHWITTLCFFALLVSGVEIVISHPRFYWGETGNDLTPPLFKLPIPASRALVPTGYGYVLRDQNGWSRYLHFQAAWVVVLTGLLYTIFGLFTGHVRKNLLPGEADLSWQAFSTAIASHLRFERPSEAEAWSYNVLQRLTYLFVIFVLFPLVIWTGLAMSPAFVSAVPALSLIHISLTDEDILSAFRAGARGLFGKSQPVQLLSKCVRSVHEGQIWADKREISIVLDSLLSGPTGSLKVGGMS